MTKRRSVMLAAVVTVVVAVGAAAAVAGHDDDGFITAQPKMLTGVMPGVEVTPLLTVGDELPGGYMFEAIPDGIALDPEGKDVDVWVNHETSKVPFPFSLTSPANNENDFDNAQLSHLVLDDKSGRVRSGEFAILGSAGYQRFCSNFLATKAEGFDRDILFVSEESPDYVARQADSWPPLPVGAPTAQKEVGLVVALDVKTGTVHPLYGMGRHNHENAVALPGFKENVVISGDDTFTSGPLTGSVPRPDGLGAGSSPQLYSYIAKDTKALLNDEGDLWAFVSDTPGVKNYYDVIPGSGTEVTGHFIKVPKDRSPPVSRLTAQRELAASSDFGYPAAANERQLADSTCAHPRRTGIDGPQWVLEYWSDINNVFQFVRVEDIAYDKRQWRGTTVAYIVDSGRGRAASSIVGHAELPVQQRPSLEDGLRQEGSDEGHVADGLRRG